MKLMYFLFFLAPSILNAKIHNFSQINENVYRGSWLNNKDDDFLELKKLEISHIINMEYFFKENKKLCKKYEINCENHPLLILPLYDRFFDYEKFKKVFYRVLSLIDENKKIYIHCLHGSDRTGALSASLMIREVACNDVNYDKNELKVKVKEKLNKHGFHRNLFPFLYDKVLSWTQKTPNWICKLNY